MLSAVADLANYTLNPYAIPPLISALAVLILGLLVLLREGIRLVSLSFLLVTASIAMWLCCFAAMYAAKIPPVGFWWAHASYLGIPLIAAGTYQFTVSVLRIARRVLPLLILVWLGCVGFGIAAATTNWLMADLYHYTWGYYPRFSWLGGPFIAFFIAVLLLSMAHYVLEYRHVPPSTHQRRLRALMIAFAVGYIGVVDFVPAYGVPLYPFGFVPVLAFTILAVHAIWVHHLIDITPAVAAAQIVETMGDILIVLDRDGLVRLVNRAASLLFGRPREQMVGRPVAAALDDPRLADQLLRISRSDPVRQQELIYSPPESQSRILSVSAAAIRNRRGQRQATVCIARDVTEHRHVEQARHESEARYRAVVEQTAEGIFLADAASKRLQEANAALQTMLGYRPDEIRTLTLYDVMADDHATIDRDLQRFLADQQSAADERQYRRKDGSLVDVEVSLNLLVLGGQEVVCGVVHNITDSKRNRERLARQLERLAALRSVDMAITGSLDLRVTLNVILDQVINRLHADAADVLLLNPHMQTLEHAAGRGTHWGAILRTRVRLGQGYPGRAALERHVLYVPDLAAASDAGASPLPEGESFGSYFAVPLIAKGQVNGVLEIYQRAVVDPDAEWQDFLETLAGQAAIAIDNANLFDDLQHSHQELALAYDTTLEGWSRALDLRDKETEGHTQRVTEMTMRLARAMGIADSELVHMRRGALLHDIGKMGIPDPILLKPGPLSEEESAIMRRHPLYAYELLAPIPFLHLALDIPYCHHEKWDGSGYPRGLKGTQIPLAARVFAVVDVWDALSSDRPYRTAWPEWQVREHIRARAGIDFDPAVVITFLNLENLPRPEPLTLTAENGTGTWTRPAPARTAGLVEPPGLTPIT